MDHGSMNNPSLTIGIAMAVGIVAQILAHHIRIPGIVLLLVAGVLLGPDVLGVIDPSALGRALSMLVGFAVAVILFEGGMNLHIPTLRRMKGPIRRLVTWGALVTAVGATAAAWLIMGWPIYLSVLFGTLVIVTGPTVITPLLKRLQVEKKTSTILAAEGVLIDPIGAIIAAVTLEIVLELVATGGAWHHVESVLAGVLNLFTKLGFGSLLGAVTGALISRALSTKRLVPEGLENIFTLSIVLALYQITDTIMPESGIAAVTLAGLVVRYLGTPVQRDLLEFKEQLTVMLIGMLFVLLAADVRLFEVQSLGWRGLWTVAALIFIVRPLNALVGTWGTGLRWQQTAFIAWIGPRGIVAAAVASLFAVRMEHHGLAGGEELRALVFLVISVTVLVAGLTGGPMAKLLGLRRASNRGWAILGAHPLGRTMARVLTSAGEETILIDVNPVEVRAAEEAGHRVIQGNAMTASVLHRAELEVRTGAIALTRNEEVNLLFARTARAEAKVKELYVAVRDTEAGVTADLVHSDHAHVLYGRAADIPRWNQWVGSGATRLERRRLVGPVDAAEGDPNHPAAIHVLPLVLLRRSHVAPFGGGPLKKDDEIVFLVHEKEGEAVRGWLDARGWETATAAWERPLSADSEP